jgi:serine/threonine protein kinase
MHHLSGVFLKEERPIVYEGVSLYAFSVIYPKKTRVYYVDNENEYKEWIKSIRLSTGYSNLTDIYEVKQKIGNGKFGQVRLGVHKETQRKVAVKVMSKKEMKTLDLELVRTEIEILKICQHPNIIRLYDVFENEEYIYIIMEHCGGGDLFSYIEKRGFKVDEKRGAQLIHKLSTAMYYLHSYGIAHRDLKPENILMTDHSDTADLRLVDFGLSKIIGPNENCEEPFGTLVSYRRLTFSHMSLLKYCSRSRITRQLISGVSV